VYNVAVGERTTLRELYAQLRDAVAVHRPDVRDLEPAFDDFRAGDMRHTLADLTRVRAALGYEPTHDLRAGLGETVAALVEELAAGERVDGDETPRSADPQDGAG
jgi:UDP-N-acetylglucosamine 4-epimerase